MPRFMSIPYEVTAVQWKGEVTDEIRTLFSHVGVNEVVTKPSGYPELVVPRSGGDPELAEIGDWIIWFNEDEDLVDDDDPELSILDDEGFRSMYEPRQKTHVDFDIGVPINVIGPGGEGTGEVRLKISGMKAESAVLAELGRQLIGGIEDQNVLRLMATQLFDNCDAETLAVLRAAILNRWVTKNSEKPDANDAS
jgi:hypothetical protein